MAQNSLYPGFVKLKYSSNGHIHYQVLPVSVESSSPGTEPQFFFRDGLNIGMDAAVFLYIDLIAPFFPAAANFIVADFWSIATPEDDPIFEYALPIGSVGTNAGAAVANGQACISHRTQGGGILKLYFMECSFSTNLKDEYPFSSAPITALTDYLCDISTGWIVGRDGFHPISPLRFLTKVNDALRKKYVLNA